MADGFLEPEFANGYNTWKKEPNPSNTHTLLKSMNPIIDSAIKTYGGSSGNSPTLRSKAKLIMINSLKNYDPSRAKLRTHMMVQLQGLRRASAKESQIISIPEQVAIESGRLNEAENVLKDTLGRDPSDLELADHTGLSRKRIGYIRTMKSTSSEGSISSRPNESGEPFVPEVEDREGGNQWQEFVYHDLDPLDQLITEHTLGLHGKKILSNQLLAQKLRLSPGAVSQRKAKIQAKLNTREEYGVL